MGDVNSKKMGFTNDVWPPNFSEELPVGENFAGVFYEEPQQGIFSWGESHFLAFLADCSRGQIDFQIARAKERFRPLLLGMT